MTETDNPSFEKLCIHTITTKPLSIEKAIKEYAKRKVRGITIWEDALEGKKLNEVRNQLTEAGMTPVSLCRGGFFASVDKNKRTAAINHNKKLIDMAAEVGANMLVLVCGADPGQDIEVSRKQIYVGIDSILSYAANRKIKLTIEPLHPMYADTRSAINTIDQALNLCDSFDPSYLGIAVDLYHVWWDPNLYESLARCQKKGVLSAFHVCDWKVPTTDFLNDRGLMGEGCIPVRKIRKYIEELGFCGFNEVEIFSENYWKTNQSDFLDKITNAYRQHT